MTIQIDNPDQEQIILESHPGKTLLEILSEAKVPIQSDCGGKGICGKCKMAAEPEYLLSEPSSAEKEHLSLDERRSGKRLACQTRQINGGNLHLSSLNTDKEKGKSVSSKIKIGSTFDADSPIKRRVLNKKILDLCENEEFSDRASLLNSHYNSSIPDFSIQALKQLSRIPEHQEKMTVVENSGQVTAIFSGSHPRSLGIAIDLGTTTLAIYLCCLVTGKLLSATSKSNSQKTYGEDVISRIDYSGKSKSNFDRLQRTVIEDINELITTAVKDAGVSIQNIDDACIVGNPTMQSILAGFSPASIGRSPYLTTTCREMNIKNQDLGLNLRQDVNVYFPPMPSAFIGGDAMAAMMAVKPPHPGERILLIDLGTNGELMLITAKGTFATSAATGPAFEGYTISCGVRAIPGAVHRVKWVAKQQGFDLSVIPGRSGQIIGLCGSGLIDAVAESVKAGLILSNGRISKSGPGIGADGSGRHLSLVREQAPRRSNNLTLTQKDIRQLQLAKAALRVGIDSLLETAGCGPVTKTIFTGAFGSNFNWKSAIAIGMIPPQILNGKIKTVNNAAGIGAVKAILDYNYREKARKISRHLQCLNLNTYPDFSSKFATASLFTSE